MFISKIVFKMPETWSKYASVQCEQLKIQYIPRISRISNEVLKIFLFFDFQTVNFIISNSLQKSV